MSAGRPPQKRLLWLFTAASLLIVCFRLVVLVMAPPPDGMIRSGDLRSRHEELRLLEQRHYPRADILLAEGVVSSANSVYPPNAFPWLWLLSPFADFRLNQLWHGAWSLAALGIVLRFAFSVGAATSRLAGLACASGVAAVTANFATFKNGQYGLILLVLMLWSTLLLYCGRSRLSGLIFGIALFKPTNAVMMAAMFLREHRFGGLAIAALVAAGSAAAVGLWSGHMPLALLAQTYPPGGMRFTDEGYSLVTLTSALGMPPRQASLFCAGIGFAGLLYALRFVEGTRDPLLVLALTGFVTRISLYHRAYDDVLLIFLLLACLRLWIAAPAPRTGVIGLALLATLNIPHRFVLAPSPAFALTLFAVWTVAMIHVVAHAPDTDRAEQPC